MSLIWGVEGMGAFTDFLKTLFLSLEEFLRRCLPHLSAAMGPLLAANFMLKYDHNEMCWFLKRHCAFRVWVHSYVCSAFYQYTGMKATLWSQFSQKCAVRDVAFY